MKYALLDFDGVVIRWFNYPATGTVEITVSFDDLMDTCGECLI